MPNTSNNSLPCQNSSNSNLPCQIPPTTTCRAKYIQQQHAMAPTPSIIYYRAKTLQHNMPCRVPSSTTVSNSSLACQVPTRAACHAKYLGKSRLPSQILPTITCHAKIPPTATCHAKIPPTVTNLPFQVHTATCHAKYIQQQHAMAPNSSITYQVKPLQQDLPCQVPSSTTVANRSLQCQMPTRAA